MAKKQIVWISDNPLRGSSFGLVTSELLTRMKDYSFEVLGLGYDGIPLKINENIRILGLSKTTQLKYYLRKFKADATVVFHSFWLLDSMMAEVDEMQGKRILYIPCEGEEVPFVYRKHFLKFDEIVTPSEYSRKTLKRSGINAKVVPHGVDTEFFLPKEKKWHEFRFGYLGMNDIRKQVPRILEAYARLKEGILVLCTTSEGHYDLTNMSKELGISPIFIESKLHGLPLTREAVRDYIQSLDLYISPATEAFGLPALEAQACGVPVVALNHGAAPEILGNGAIYASLADYLHTSVGKIGLVSIPDLYRQMRFMVQVKNAWIKTSEKALANSKNWPWEKATETLMKVIEE